MKSVGTRGTRGALQRRRFGGVASSSNLPLSWGARSGRKTPCKAAGRMRYSQLRRLSARGAVKAVPEYCSAYSPYGQRCGEFRPSGRAPGSASVAK